MRLPVVAALAAAAASLAPQSAIAQPSVESIFMDPVVVPAVGGGGAFLFVRVNVDPASVTVRLATGEHPLSCTTGATLSLSPLGPDPAGGYWHSAILDPTQLVGTYLADDFNRNLVGCLRIDAAGVSVSASSVVAAVDDSAIVAVTVTEPGPEMRCSPHVVNVRAPSAGALFEPTASELEDVERLVAIRFFQTFPDTFDFLNVVYAAPGRVMNRSHAPLRVDATGIGLSGPDRTRLFGSAGALRGITRFPALSLFDMGHTAALHEIGHQWMSFLPHPLLLGSSPHWPPSDLARHIMGVSLYGGQGGTFPYELLPLGPGIAQVSQTLNSALPGTYHPLELYLMGFAEADEVPAMTVVDPPDQAIVDGAVVTTSPLTLADITALTGPRTPDAASAPRDFRVATIVVTGLDLLSDREMAYFDHFAARAEATSALDWGVGTAKSVTEGQSKPFAVATGFRGTLDASIPCPAKVGDPIKGPESVQCFKIGKPVCPSERPAPFGGLETSLTLAAIGDETVRRALRSAVASAAEAYYEGQVATARNLLEGLARDVEANAGHAINPIVSRSLARLARGVASRIRG